MTVTRAPARASTFAAYKPPKPPPTITTPEAVFMPRPLADAFGPAGFRVQGKSLGGTRPYVEHQGSEQDKHGEQVHPCKEKRTAREGTVHRVASRNRDRHGGAELLEHCPHCSHRHRHHHRTHHLRTPRRN